MACTKSGTMLKLCLHRICQKCVPGDSLIALPFAEPHSRVSSLEIQEMLSVLLFSHRGLTARPAVPTYAFSSGVMRSAALLFFALTVKHLHGPAVQHSVRSARGPCPVSIIRCAPAAHARLDLAGFIRAALIGCSASASMLERRFCEAARRVALPFSSVRTTHFMSGAFCTAAVLRYLRLQRCFPVAAVIRYAIGCCASEGDAFRRCGMSYSPAQINQGEDMGSKIA
eukprot:IDg4658t1